MSSRDYINIKFAGLYGLLSAFVFFIFIGLAIYYTPWFSWTDNFVSDIAGPLGKRPIWAAKGLSSIILNLGFIIAGLIGVLFSLSIKKSKIFNTSWGKLSTYIMIIDMLALCGIGVFPLTTGNIHIFNTVIMFALIPMLIIVTGYHLRSLYGEKWWLVSNILCGISISSIFVFVFTGAKAIAEMMAWCSLFVFLMFISFKFISLGFDSEVYLLKKLFNLKT